MDYEQLIGKFLHYLRLTEGSDFVSWGINESDASCAGMTDEEIDLIRRIAEKTNPGYIN